MSSTHADPPATLEAVVSELAARLPVGVGRGRSGVLQEAYDGLLDAAEAYEQQGRTRDEACRQAVADFGDLDDLAQDYAEDAAGGQARLTGTVLTLGYLLNLAAWALLELVGPGVHHSGHSSWASSSFSIIGILAAGVTAAVFLASRRRARSGRGAQALAWVAGATGLVCALATLVAAWVVQPWGGRTVQSWFTWMGSVEMLSAVLTFSILAVSVRCLWSAAAISLRGATPARRRGLNRAP
jgi:hypothetical protein